MEALLHRCEGTQVAELLLDLIRIPSPNPPGRELEVAEFIRAKMNALGMKAECDEVLPGRPNVIGSLEFSSNGTTLLFDVHTDTNPPGDESLWHFDPYFGIVKEGKIYGRGAVDDKGSMAAVLSAIEAILDSDLSPKGRLIVAGAMGEESTAEKGSALMGTKHYLKRGLRADMAVVGEPTSNRIAIAHKGAYRPLLRVKGRAAHSSIPHEGINAIEKGAALVSALEEFNAQLATRRHPILGSGTLTVTWISGGWKPNTVPPSCDIIYDRRLIPGETEELSEQEVRSILKRLSVDDKEFSAELVDVLSYFEPAETDPAARIVQIASQSVESVTGSAARLTALPAGCDMSLLVNQAKIPTIVLGPGDLQQAHIANEYMQMKQLIDGTKIYALLIMTALS